MKRQEVHDPFADSSTTPFWDLAIMLWTYYAMMVVLFGAAFTRAVNEEHDERHPD